MPRKTEPTVSTVVAASVASNNPPAIHPRRVQLRRVALSTLNLLPAEGEAPPPDVAPEPLVEIGGFRLPNHGASRILIVRDPEKGAAQQEGTIPTWVANALVRQHGELYAEVKEGSDGKTA